MYELYSQQRPGRPRWALGASAVVLLMTVGLALAVIEQKERSLRASLSDVQTFPRAGLKCAIPKGWTLLPQAKNPPSMVLIAQETGTRGAARHLFVFRDVPSPLGTPLRDGLTSLREQLASLNALLGLVDQPRMEAEDARIGPLPGWEVRSTKVSAGGAVLDCISRVALAPAGQIVGLILLAPGEIRARDHKLIEQIADSLRLLDVRSAENPTAVMQSAGIQFDLPSEVQLFEDSGPNTASIQLTGGSGKSCWFLSAYRVPLLSNRTPAALVRDFCLTSLERPQLPARVETIRIRDHDAAQIHYGADSSDPDRLYVLSVQTDRQTALTLIGRHDEEGFEELARVARSVAQKAKVAPYHERLDLARARSSAIDWLSDRAKHGLGSVWKNTGRSPIDFAIRAPAIDLGAERRILGRESREGTVWWTLDVGSREDRNHFNSIEKWRMRDDGRRYSYRADMLVGKVVRTEYEETRSGDEVHRELSVQGYPPQNIDTHVGNDFIIEPLLIKAAAFLARSKGPPAVFSSTSIYTSELSHWIVLPLDPQPIPGKEETRAPAALLQRDFDPMPIVLSFAEDDSLLAARFAGGRYQIRTSESEHEGAGD